MGLDGRYGVASLPVLVVAMLGLGLWVTDTIQENVIHKTAVNASLFVNSFVSPELQGLARQPQLGEEEARALGALLTETPLGRTILSFKVWQPGGRIAYYSRGNTPRHTFEPTPNLLRAWQGAVVAELSSLDDDESAFEHSLDVPLLEVYMPVREGSNGRVIAVAEFYQDATELQADIAKIRLRTWLVVAAAMIGMYGLLFGIVHSGGRLIRKQASELGEKVEELSMLLANNEALRQRVGRATRRITELNEAFLRRLSAELHDGPAQALGLALLRLDNVVMPAKMTAFVGEDGGDGAELEQVRQTLDEALREIRHLSRGLSLPELEGLDLREVVERAAAAHRRRTSTEVALDFADLPPGGMAAMPIKLTAYRIVQEALMNAFRHAGGEGQTVSARRMGGSLELRVRDRGHGMPQAGGEEASERLGLSGLRERVEILGGRFTIESEPGHGTTLIAVLPLE